MHVAMLLSLTVAMAADPFEEPFLDGLRERRLFALAETYCLDRLKDPVLREERRAELVIELSRAYANHAQSSLPAGAEPLWKQALGGAKEFSQRHPQSRWLVFVKAQAAAVLLARGESLLEEAMLTPPNSDSPDEASGYLRTAAEQCSDLRKDAAIQLQQTRGGGDERQPSREQLRMLQHTLAFQMARALRGLGQATAASSHERVRYLSQAQELLKPLSQLAPADPLYWQSRLEEIACSRLQGDSASAARKLNALLEEQKIPPAVALRARAENIRLALAMNRLDVALQTAQAGRTVDGQASAELDLAALQAFVAARRSAEQDQQAEEARQWQQRSVELLEHLKQQGLPWSRRGESALVGKAPAMNLPPSGLELLVRAAEKLYRDGDLDGAVAAYDKAQIFAANQKQPEATFDLAYAAATIEHERKRHRAAVDRYRRLAIEMHENPKAGETHLLAVLNSAEEARLREPVSLDEYASLLEEHLRLWPAGRSADQAYWLFGRLQEHRGDWPSAIQSYGRISPEHPQFAAAIDATARGYAVQIEQLRREGQPAQERIVGAARHFERLFLDESNLFPERFSPAQRSAALPAARMWLLCTPPDFDRAQRIANAALNASPDSDAAWKAAAQGVLLVSLAGQGQVEAARKMTSEVAAAGPADLLALLEGLSQMTRAAPDALRRDVAGLAGTIAQSLAPRRSELSADGQAQFDRLAAQALVDSGRTAEALTQFAQLAQTHPRDGQIQEQYATLLVETGDKPSLETALSKWREVEQRSKPASPRWFRAKYHLALAHEKLGNKQHATQIVTLTQVLHPELGGPELKARFLELLARCHE